MLLFVEQVLNGLQFGVMLFLIAAGLTLVLGVMNMVNLAHGSLYMLGAFVTAWATIETGSFLLGVAAAVLATAAAGALIELLVVRRLYERNHLDQVLATFGLILFFNELAKILWGPRALRVDMPPWLSGSVEIVPGIPYPVFRLAIIGVGLAVALFLYVLVMRTRIGMLLRAGATNREMLGALGVNIRRLYTTTFALGAVLAGLAGVMAGPVYSVQIGMGENILIVAFVVIIIGGVGSIRGAFIGSLLVGMVFVLCRVFLPQIFTLFMAPAAANAVGTSLSAMAIYMLMAAVLLWRPRGLFTGHG
ncbi:MAG: branched-chain amino acid ABC transporter permease [Acetobacteraceae bacterium]|nr:branched-chain amino acid ABC transporter permease [Acetobacteraceae bacterium]